MTNWVPPQLWDFLSRKGDNNYYANYAWVPPCLGDFAYYWGHNMKDQFWIIKKKKKH